MLSTDSFDDFLSITGLNLIIPKIGSPSSQQTNTDNNNNNNNNKKIIINNLILAKGLLLNSNKSRGKEERPYKCALISEQNKNEVTYFLILVPSLSSKSIDVTDHIIIPMNSNMSINPSFLLQRKLDENDFNDYSNNKIELSNGDGKSIIFKFEDDDSSTMQGKWHKALKEVITELIFKDAFVYGPDNKISIQLIEEVIQRAKKLVHTKNCHLTRARFIRDNKIKIQTMLIKLLDDPNGIMLVSKEEVDEIIKLCGVDSFLSNDSDIKTLKLAAPYLLTSEKIIEMKADYNNGNGLNLIDNENHEDIHHKAFLLALTPSPSKDMRKSSKNNQSSPLPSYYSPSSKANILLSSSKSQKSPSVASDNSNFSQASSAIYNPFPEKVFDFSVSIESWINKRKAELQINEVSSSINDIDTNIESKSFENNKIYDNSNNDFDSKPVSPIAETKDKGRRGLNPFIINQNEMLSLNNKPVLKPLQVSYNESEDFSLRSVIGSKSDIDIVDKKSSVLYIKKSYIFIFIMICILGIFYLLLKLLVPTITVLHMDQDKLVLRIDRKRSSLKKPIPLSLQYNSIEKVDQIFFDKDQIDISTALTTLSSSSSSSSFHSIKVISQMKTRLKQIFKPFVDVANFFGGLLFGNKK